LDKLVRDTIGDKEANLNLVVEFSNFATLGHIDISVLLLTLI
jgi:hypothetical protein